GWASITGWTCYEAARRTPGAGAAGAVRRRFPAVQLSAAADLGPAADGAWPAASAGGAVRDLGGTDRGAGLGQRVARRAGRQGAGEAEGAGRMIQPGLVLAVSFGYLLLLVAVAAHGDRRADQGRSLIDSSFVYALSWGVYCSAWTYFGSVGRAASG